MTEELTFALDKYTRAIEQNLVDFIIYQVDSLYTKASNDSKFVNNEIGSQFYGGKISGFQEVLQVLYELKEKNEER